MTRQTDASFHIPRPQPLAAQVYDNLRVMMQSRLFEPGERMVEEDLARRLAVSRTPVREALRRLQENGLVEQQDGRFVVARLTLRDIHEIFAIRRLLEPEAVAGIADRITPPELPPFLEARNAVAQADAPDTATAANVAFRNLWLSRIDNRRLQETLVKFDDQVVLVRRATLGSAAARRVALDGVRDLVAAFAARDPDAARACMQDFVDAALTHFERAVRDSADPR